MVFHERSGRRVAGQEARQVAAAVETKIEGIEGTHAAGVKRARALADQVFFAASQQLRTDAPVLIGRSDANDAGHPAGRGHSRFRIVASESRMSKADADRAVYRDDQTRRFEIRLGENKSFQRRPMTQLHATATQERFVPNLNQTWRIVVPIVSVLNHEANLSSPNLELRT